MAITTTALGPNSAQLTVDSGSTKEQILAALVAEITLHGWEVFDGPRTEQSFANVNAIGTYTYSILRAPHYGLPTLFKYVALIVGASGIVLRPMESWNKTTRAELNPAQNFYSGGVQYVFGTASPNSLGGGLLYGIPNLAATATFGLLVYANPRWLGLRHLDMATNIAGITHFVGEYKRDYMDDQTIPTTFITHLQSPAFAWSSNRPGVASSAGHFTTCRSLAMAGAPASGNLAPNRFAFPLMGVAGDSLGVMLATTNSAVYTQWSTNKAIVPMAAEYDGVPVGPGIKGRMFGLKFIMGKQVWNDRDKCQIKCDEDGFPSDAGTLVDHLVFSPGYTYWQYVDRWALPA